MQHLHIWTHDMNRYEGSPEWKCGLPFFCDEMGTGKQKTAGQDGMLKHRNGISNSFTVFLQMHAFTDGRIIPSAAYAECQSPRGQGVIWSYCVISHTSSCSILKSVKQLQLPRLKETLPPIPYHYLQERNIHSCFKPLERPGCAFPN